MYLEAVSIKNSKSQSTPEDSQDSNSKARATELCNLFSFSPRDLEFVVKFKEENGSDIFRQILQSICPSIYGHELVKGNVICTLFIVVIWSKGFMLNHIYIFLIKKNCSNSFFPHCLFYSITIVLTLSLYKGMMLINPKSNVLSILLGKYRMC